MTTNKATTTTGGGLMRVLGFIASLLLILVGGVSIATAAQATGNGNNGTLKIHEKGTPSGTEDNDPKVCEFNVEGFGFDAGQTGYLKFEVQGGDGPTGQASGPFDFGPTNSDGYHATRYFSLENGHYKATLYGKMLPGGQLEDVKAKSKVFKVVCTPGPEAQQPAAVTFNDGFGRCVDNKPSYDKPFYTIPVSDIANYYDGETKLTAGKHEVDFGSSVTITAKAKTDVPLKAPTSWSHTFLDKPAVHCELSSPLVDASIGADCINGTVVISGQIINLSDEKVKVSATSPVGDLSLVLGSNDSDTASKDYQVQTGKKSISAGVMTFTAAWADGSPGEFVFTRDYDAVGDCEGTPPPPPPTDACPNPNMPGNQPAGTDCTPPPPPNTEICPDDSVHWDDANGNGVEDSGECVPNETPKPTPKPSPVSNTVPDKDTPDVVQSDDGAISTLNTIPVPALLMVALGLMGLLLSGLYQKLPARVRTQRRH